MTPMLGIMASSISGSKAITGSFESIATVTGTGASPSQTLTFSSIPGTYKSLQIRGTYKDTVAGSTNLYIQFNGDTASNYVWHNINGDGSSASATGGTAYTYGMINYAGRGSTPTNTVGVSITDIIDYASTTKFKTSKIFSGVDINTAGGGLALTSVLWRSTSAITSITLSMGGNYFSDASTFALYGIKG